MNEVISLKGKLIGDTETSWHACFICNQQASSIASYDLMLKKQTFHVALCKMHVELFEKGQLRILQR